MATIVIMEDEASTRNAMKTLLERQGYTILAFEDAAPALAEVDFGTVDLVLVDLQMPTSGYEAIDEIRDRGFNTLPIVVISAYVDLQLTPELLEVQRIMRKPFESTAILEAARELIKT